MRVLARLNARLFHHGASRFARSRKYLQGGQGAARADRITSVSVHVGREWRRQQAIFCLAPRLIELCAVDVVTRALRCVGAKIVWSPREGQALSGRYQLRKLERISRVIPVAAILVGQKVLGRGEHLQREWLFGWPR